MRDFKDIYREMKFYGGFCSDPMNKGEAIRSVNAFFAEIYLDIINDKSTQEEIRAFEFLNASYRWSADQWFLNSCDGTDSRSFKQFLNSIHTALNMPKPVEAA